MAVSWRQERLADAWLYLCMDRRADREDLDGFLDTVLGAGVDLLQLRDKTATRDQLAAASAVFRAAADRHGALFILNDDARLAAEVGADGVHVGQDDLHPSDARVLVGPDAIVGRSTHSTQEVDRALDEDCDYFAVGPVHATPTKQGRPAIGLEPLRHAAALAQQRPWFVTGDMSLRTAPEVLATGARRLVVVRAVTEAPDPARAVTQLARLLRG
ncbi:MAG: thiamine phosphate synthase [Actinomycetota bacterium]|nr:thiamine phosphate synthase [Actinomycetota bacterium]